MQKIKVLIVDDQPSIHQRLHSQLMNSHLIEVVGVATNGQEAIKVAAELTPELILMDIQMPILDGVQATRMIKNLYPWIKILILATFDEAVYLFEALASGANGYISKDLPFEDLVSVIQSTQYAS